MGVEMTDEEILTYWDWDRDNRELPFLEDGKMNLKEGRVTRNWKMFSGDFQFMYEGSKIISHKGGGGGESLDYFLREKCGQEWLLMGEKWKVCWLQIYYGWKLFFPPSPLSLPNLSLFQKLFQVVKCWFLHLSTQITDFSPAIRDSERAKAARTDDSPRFPEFQWWRLSWPPSPFVAHQPLLPRVPQLCTVKEPPKRLAVDNGRSKDRWSPSRYRPPKNCSTHSRPHEGKLCWETTLLRFFLLLAGVRTHHLGALSAYWSVSVIEEHRVRSKTAEDEVETTKVSFYPCYPVREGR